MLKNEREFQPKFEKDAKKGFWLQIEEQKKVEVLYR